MKKKLLAVAALTAAYVLPAEAAMFKVDENTFANFGVRMQIRGQHLGEKRSTDKSDIRFSVPNAQIYFAGQVNKFVYFGASFETRVEPATDAASAESIRPFDAFMGIRLGDIFGAKDTMNLQAGLQRIPVSRLYLTSSYSFIVPTGPTYNLGGADAHGTPLVFRPIQQASDVGYGSFRHGGVTLWGNLADGMIKYYLGWFDVKDEDDPPGGSNLEKSMYTVRLQFTPTMLGFKPEKAYALADTYLGRQNVLTLGLGYGSQKYTGTGAKTASEFAIDLLYEQKFGDIVPNFQAAYKTMQNYQGVGTRDGKAYYVQGQLLYDQVVGIGKPALAIRYAKNDPKNTWSIRESSVIGAFVNYYIKGNDAKVAFGFDSVKVDNKPTNAKNYTDVTLHLQVQF